VKPRKAPPPEAYEYSLVAERLDIVAEQLNTISYQLYNQNAKKGRQKKVKPLKLPTPVTAASVLRKEEARAAFAHIESVVRFVPVEEYQALAQHHQDTAGRDA